MKFQVEIPDNIFWKIAARAETFNQRVPDFTTDLLLTAAATRSPVDTDPVLRLWREGLTDKQIGARLDLTNATVAGRRRRHGSPANRKARTDG